MALISSDRDFAPVLSYLRDQGHRIIHVSASMIDQNMTSLSWSHINLSDTYTTLCKINMDGYTVFSTPHCTVELAELKRHAPVDADKLRIIDLTDKTQIGDEDLSFIVSHLNMYWPDPGKESNLYFDIKKFGSISKFRKLLSEGAIWGNLPYVLRNGQSEIFFTNHDHTFPWIVSGSTGAGDRWRSLREKR